MSVIHYDPFQLHHQYTAQLYELYLEQHDKILASDDRYQLLTSHLVKLKSDHSAYKIQADDRYNALVSHLHKLELDHSNYRDQTESKLKLLEEHRSAQSNFSNTCVSRIVEIESNYAALKLEQEALKIRVDNLIKNHQLESQAIASFFQSH